MDLRVNGEQLDLDPGRTAIYYVDEKPPEFSMQGLQAGIIAVIVVVTLAVIAGIVVLVSIEQVNFPLRAYSFKKRRQHETATSTFWNILMKQKLHFL